MSPINQKIIAKNTILLYIRMGILMLISLYTSRVILDALGDIDMGIYNAVGGIVIMFSFLSGTMSVACQRYYAIEIGKKDYEELAKIFSLCVFVFLAIILIIVVLSETVGLWFLLNKVKTEGRLDAAKWVFQFSILSFVFSIIRTPFQGMIIIREKMNVYAYISIFEALGNLLIAILISRSSNDRLILYAALIMVINIIVSLFYIIYCLICYKECKPSYYWNNEKFKNIFSFASWNMIGALSGLCKSQGLNLLLNIFFGPVVNASRAMAYKVYTTANQFVENFYTAAKPQIIKLYSVNDLKGMEKLVIQSSKFSFFLIFVISLPIMLETDVLLDIWLKDVPERTAIFTKLVLANAMIDTLANPLATAMQAYGNIKKYHLVCGGFTLQILPVSYLFLKLGFPCETVFIVSIVFCAISIWIRVLFVNKDIGLSLSEYFKKAILPILVVIIAAIPIPLFFELYLDAGLTKFIIVVFSSIATVCLSVFLFGLTVSERDKIIDIAFQFLKIRK